MKRLAPLGFCAALLGSIFFLQPWSRAADDVDIAESRKELLPRSVTIQSESITLGTALAELSRQTGNAVTDRRQNRGDSKLKLDLRNSTFWPALEAIAKAAGCGISTYQPDRQIAMVDAPLRPTSTIFEGIFRVMSKRVRAERDDGNGTHSLTVTLDIAWEPRFEPLYLEIGAIEATYGTDEQGLGRKSRLAGQGKISVAGLNAKEIDIHLPAPSRSVAKIKTLDGQFTLFGPGKMVTFTFPRLHPLKKGDNPLQQRQNGIDVSVVEIKAASSRWSMEVHIANGKGNPELESYQSWLGNNRILLQKGAGASRQVWQPRPGDERVELETAARAEIVYNFVIPAKGNKGPISDWTLVYEAPGRIVDVSVPFHFKDLPLP